MARTPIARYAVTFGLSGCYMPDYHGCAFEVTTRRELAAAIRDELRMLDLPASLFREVGINRLWAFIKRYGSSSAHFSLHHGANVLQFHGLTEEEFQQQQEQE
jgi:hypothetical protein